MPNPRPEIEEIVGEIKRELTADCLYHVCEGSDENADFYSIAAHDKNDYANTGLIGWNEAAQQVQFYCYNPLRANHDEAEGLSEDESKCWWAAPSLPIFLMFLKGEVRTLLTKVQKAAEMDEKELDSGE